MAEPLSRRAIIDATRAFITEEGLEALSLRRIGSRLEVTAPALYAYVSDKRDLLRAVAQEEYDQLIAAFEAVADDDPVERTRAYSRAYVAHARANPELFKTMFLFQPDLGVGEPPESGNPSATAAFELPAAALREAIDAGRFRPVDPLMASLTMWVAVHGITDMVLMGFDVDDTFIDDLVDATVDTLIRGFSA
jgi:AcrR family transcriptional regulator